MPLSNSALIRDIEDNSSFEVASPEFANRICLSEIFSIVSKSASASSVFMVSISSFGDNSFARLRIGVGKPVEKSLVNSYLTASHISEALLDEAMRMDLFSDEVVIILLDAFASAEMAIVPVTSIASR